MKTKQEVEEFLNQFGIKFDIWGIFYLDRDKNEEALKALGITPRARDEIVRQLQPNDYVETLPAEYFDEMWVFGKDTEGTELYIKIAMGQPNSQTICISFHIADHSINYPYKKEI
ncbi:MAG: type II toxin-antitoxin system MqsR family toxin [Bacteroidales bacterium]|nr:type II toxin-antitoxin system MqsR family toxin [Bacteroidales bacterium]